MVNLLLNGISVKTPKSLKVSIQDIDGQTTRTAAGTMIRDRITVKRKIECEWGPLSSSESRTILNAISGEFFTVSYPDPQQGQVDKKFYCGDRSMPIYSFHSKFNVFMWVGLTVNFIEQ